MRQNRLGNVLVHALTGLVLLGLLGGCSGIKPYPNKQTQNLYISTERSSGSVLTSIKMAVDIYRVNADCTTVYEGTVQLPDKTATIGIPAGRLSYLDFVFANSGFFSNSSSTITSGTLLKPRKGYRYDIEARYIDAIYNVEIREKSPGKKQGRLIEPGDMRNCRPK